MNHFEGLDDDLDGLINSPLRPADSIRPVPKTQDHLEPCKKCRGTGRFVSYSGRTIGQCFACKGVGKRAFKTSPDSRAKDRAAKSARKLENATSALDSFKSEYPEIFAWIESSQDFVFAVSMREAITKYGQLTDNQLAACQRCVDGRKRAAGERAARAENAPQVDISRIELALNSALASGLKRPRLLLDSFKFTLAPASGKNAGAIYVKDGAEYLGKVAAGKFHCVAACGDERQARVLSAAANPQAAAIAYGKLTGACSCCGRTLTDSESVARGIGPICATKYGW